MQGRRSDEDELARRRATRQSLSSREQEDLDEKGEALPKLGWKDTFAMIIAAYQILLPIVGGMLGALLLVYLLFRWFFT